MDARLAVSFVSLLEACSTSLRLSDEFGVEEGLLAPDGECLSPRSMTGVEASDDSPVDSRDEEPGSEKEGERMECLEVLFDSGTVPCRLWYLDSETLLAGDEGDE